MTKYNLKMQIQIMVVWACVFWLWFCFKTKNINYGSSNCYFSLYILWHVYFGVWRFQPPVFSKVYACILQRFLVRLWRFILNRHFIHCGRRNYGTKESRHWGEKRQLKPPLFTPLNHRFIPYFFCSEWLIWNVVTLMVAKTSKRIWGEMLGEWFNLRTARFEVTLT